jgi:hypothetical protein
MDSKCRTPGSDHASIALNTLEEAVQLARALAQDLSTYQSKASRCYRVFSALTTNDREALAAFFIWQGRRRLIKEWSQSVQRGHED